MPGKIPPLRSKPIMRRMIPRKRNSKARFALINPNRRSEAERLSARPVARRRCVAWGSEDLAKPGWREQVRRQRWCAQDVRAERAPRGECRRRHRPATTSVHSDRTASAVRIASRDARRINPRDKPRRSQRARRLREKVIRHVQFDQPPKRLTIDHEDQQQRKQHADERRRRAPRAAR